MAIVLISGCSTGIIGNDASALINWRTAMTAEDWLSSQNIEDDESWASVIEEQFDLKVKPHFK